MNVYKQLQSAHKLIFVDGGSTDSTQYLLQENGFHFIRSSIKGRGAQLAAGAAETDEVSTILVFLHVDTELPKNFDQYLLNNPKDSDWGFFRVKLDSDQFMYRVIQGMMNFRSRLTGIATGDQCIFVKNTTYQRHIHRLQEHPLMEDIYLSKTLKSACGRGKIIQQAVITSARYWKKSGVLRTIFNMWRYRLLFFFGAKPQNLYSRYYK